MSAPAEGSGPVVRVALKRIDLWELVQSETALRTAPFARAMGLRLEPWLSAATSRRYADRAVLFQQGDAGNSLLFVLRGEIRLSGRKGSDIVELGTAHRGEVLGETEVMNGQPQRATSAVAHGEADVAEVPRQALLERGELVTQLIEFLRPIREARHHALTEMTDFMDRW